MAKLNLKYSDWMEYWNNKGSSVIKDQKHINGYEGKLSYLSDSAYRSLINSIKKILKLSKKDSLLDVGCGGGILTIALQKYVNNVVGVDGSAEMLQHVPKTIETHVARADELPFLDNKFDKILCHSIFQYFTDVSYARTVLEEIERVCKPNGLIYIVDIPDESKKEKYEANKKIEDHNLNRLFYSTGFFIDVWPRAKIFDNNLKGYGNAKYRFNVLFQK